jgi:glutathione S-transferase
MTSVPVLHFAPHTCARVTLTALEEIGEPFETRVVAFMAGEHRAPAYLAINPAGKVPALETAQGVIVQNGAILTYLAQRHPAAGLLPIGDGPQALQALSDLFRISADLHPLVTRFVLPQMMTTQADQATPIRDKACEILTSQLAPLEQRLAGQAWMLGSHWSIIDAYLAWIWFRVTGAGFDPDAFPALDRHYAAASARPSALAALVCEAQAQDKLKARGLFFQPPPNN